MESLTIKLIDEAKKILETLGIKIRGKSEDIDVAQQNSMTFPGMITFGNPINYENVIGSNIGPTSII